MNREHKYVSVSDFKWLEDCQRHVWLEARGVPRNPAKPTPAVTSLANRGLEHEGALVRRDYGPFGIIPVRDWAEGLRATREDMNRGVQFVWQGYLQAQVTTGLVLRGVVDVLERVDVPSRLGGWAYRPIEIKLHHKAKDRDWLQLSAYQWLLEQIQGVVVPGELRVGNQVETWRRDRDDFSALLREWEALRLQDHEPPIWFDKPCHRCNWRNDCEESALARNDIVLLNNLRRRTAEELRRAGFSSVADIAGMSEVDLGRYPDLGSKSAPLLKAAALALQSNKPVRLPHHSWPERLPQASVFLDIETDPSTQEPWAFGLAASEQDIMIIIVCAEIAGLKFIVNGLPVIFVAKPADGWQYLAERVQRTAGSIIHWGTHEATVLRRDTARLDVLTTIDPGLVDAHKYAAGHWALPTPRLATRTSGTMKAVGAWLGVEWPAGLKNGLATFEWFRQWRQTGRMELLKDLIAYQNADLAALIRAWSWLCEHDTVD